MYSYIFGSAAWPVRSKFPNQGLNLGQDSESAETLDTRELPSAQSLRRNDVLMPGTVLCALRTLLSVYNNFMKCYYFPHFQKTESSETFDHLLKISAKL